MPDIKGMHSNQPLSASNLRPTDIGQSSIVRAILAALVFLSCALAGSLLGFYSAQVIGALLLAVADKTRLSFSIVSVVTAVWLITAIRLSPRKNITITLLTLLLGIAIQQWCVTVYPQRFQDFFWLDVLVDLLPPFTIVIIGFLVTRFNLALADILWRKPIRTSAKAIGFVITALAAMFGAYSSLSLRIYFLSKRGITVTFEQSAIILLGAVFVACTIVVSAWIANRVRRAPWNHTGFLHPLVLSVGSWKGTSFRDLDLSHLSFEGANVSNSDLRARKLYRTSFRGAIGLDRAKLDSRYLDLELPKVQQLLAQGCSNDTDFRRLNLRGAYLQNADLRRLDFTEADLTGADFRNADLRGAIFVCANVTGVDFSDANLTGICIQDWNVNRETLFTNVVCDYIYRKIDEKGEPIDRYPLDRNFDDREFESLYQEVGNVVDLVFKEGINWRAFAFTLQKLQIEDEGLGLELKGIEKRGDLWIVKVTHNDEVPTSVVEQHLMASYQRLQTLLAEKEQQITKLLDIASDQADAMKSLSKQPFGNNFNIFGSTITNLAGSGQIEYQEASTGVRSLVTNPVNPDRTLQQLIYQLTYHNVATTAASQGELIQQVLLAEAEHDPAFRAFLLEQGQQVIDRLPDGEIAIALQTAIRTLQNV